MQPTRQQWGAGWALTGSLLSGILWGVAIFMVVFTGLMVSHRQNFIDLIERRNQEQIKIDESSPSNAVGAAVSASLPAFDARNVFQAIVRFADMHTVIPTRSRAGIVHYTIQKGDSIFSIANKYGLKPETILWANYDKLKDDPDMISLGLDLNIPAVDGVFYKWKDNDKIDDVAAHYKTTSDAILNWPGNNLDLANPVIKSGTYVMLPGGKREMQQWIVPTIWRANSGANKSIAGGCSTSGGAMGTGSFVWPAPNHYLSGNDYWSGHLGIDIAAGSGAPVYAADSGVVVYAAPIGGGYGNMIMIDHGNGYHTLYAHLSSINVSCGQSVGQGQMIGLAGSTGNSTGAHLHFEVRYMGGFINPWHVLP